MGDEADGAGVDDTVDDTGVEENNGSSWSVKKAAGYMDVSGDVSEGVTMGWGMKRASFDRNSIACD
jgi:hypothetical protein